MEANHSPTCVKKAALIEEFHLATLEFANVVESTLAYSTVVVDLAGMEASVKQEEFKRINAAIDNARRNSQIARDLLAHHITEHSY
jgi:hypothetical protein